MKQFYLKFYTLLLCLVIGGGNSWAASPWSVTSFSGSISNSSITINKATWSLKDMTVGSNTKGNPAMTISSNKLKFGSSKDQFWSSYTLTTDYFNDYNVTKVVIGCYDNGGTESEVTVTQGSVTIGSATVSTTSTANEETLNATQGNGGTLNIKFTSTKQASYITSVTVYYLEDGAEEIKVTGVSLNQNSIQILDGETVNLIATIAPSNASNKKIVWTSSDTNVAKVSNGVVTGISEGTATVTVTTEDGNKTASCLVTVKLSDINRVKYTYDFNDMSSFPESFPTSGTKTATKEEFVISGHPIVINAKDAYYIINSTTVNRGLFFGKTSTSNSKPIDGTSYLGFPAKEGYKLTKVVATLTNGCAGSLPVNIYESSSWKEKSTSVNTVNGQKAVLEFEINEPEENTPYRLTAGGSSGKNLQFDNIVLIYEKVIPPIAFKATNGNGIYWATFSNKDNVILPNEVIIDEENTDFAELTVYTVNSDNDGNLTLTEIEDLHDEECWYLPADQGYLLKSESTKDAEHAYTYTIGDADLFKDLEQLLPNNMLVPSYTPMTSTDNLYYKLTTSGGKNLGFYWGAADGEPFTMTNQNAAYLAVPKSDALVKAFTLDDLSTVIERIENTLRTDAPIYNVAGQRVNASAKGILIQNGKKFYNK